MMILCLHGVGSSGSLLERQMVNLRRELDPAFELVFVDGPFACNRGPGVPKDYPGPFFSHTRGYSPADIEEAVDYLEDILDAEGPFDGIFAFSQGAALTLSYLHRQQASGGDLKLKFACLFSAAIPCSTDASVGEEVVSRLRSLEYDITDRDSSSYSSLTPPEQELVDILQETVVTAADHDPHFPWADMNLYRYGDSEAIPRVMYASLLAQKIQIPTIHVWGQKDFGYMIKMAQVARNLCDESLTQTVLHGGYHDIPRNPLEVKAVLRKLDWAVRQM